MENVHNCGFSHFKRAGFNFLPAFSKLYILTIRQHFCLKQECNFIPFFCSNEDVISPKYLNQGFVAYKVIVLIINRTYFFMQVILAYFLTLFSKEGKDQESIQSRMTRDTTWESDKNTINHHKQECQEVSPFPAGDHKDAMNRQENKTNTKHK